MKNLGPFDSFSDALRASCPLIQYIFLLHNHPFASELSERDVYLAAAMSHAHALVNEAGGRKVPFAVIAFFSQSKDEQNPSCDGFYQYIPATSELLKWLKTGDSWQRGQAGRVEWLGPTKFIITKD